jgi:hypothetical protein
MRYPCTQHRNQNHTPTCDVRPKAARAHAQHKRLHDRVFLQAKRLEQQPVRERRAAGQLQARAQRRHGLDGRERDEAAGDVEAGDDACCAQRQLE